MIIFKNQVENEVSNEITSLENMGINHHHIPFRWKQLASIELGREQTVEALNIIHQVKLNNGKDRAGMLAGPYRMLEEKVSKSKVFKEEMCARGYSDGNSHKPRIVTGAIQTELRCNK